MDECDVLIYIDAEEWARERPIGEGGWEEAPLDR